MEGRGTTAASSVFIAGHAVVDEVIDSPLQKIPRLELGGALCYSALVLKSLGYETEIVTRVGEDFPRKYSRFLLSDAGIDIEEWRTKNQRTTRYRIDRSGRERRLWLLSKCGDLTFGDFKRAFDDVSLALPKVLILNPVAGEISMQLLKRISKEFEHVFLDSQGFTRSFEEKTGLVSMKTGLDISSLAGVDFLKADVEELYAWTAIKDKQGAIVQLSTFVDNIIITSGATEVELYKQGKLSFRSAPLRVDVKDTIGAGDIMLASFAVRFLETNDLKESLEFATTSSSLAVERIGIRKAILPRLRIIEEQEKVRIE
ncbi:MAG: PfkB family carbohydrate kinase [Nitrososphaerales archaeon]